MDSSVSPLLIALGALVVVLVVAAFVLGRKMGERAPQKTLPGSDAAQSVAPSTQEALQEPFKQEKLTQDVTPAILREPQPAKEPERSWLSRLASGLSKTQTQLVRQIEVLLLSSKEERVSREAVLDALLEILVRADVGIRTSELLIEKVRGTIPASEMGNSNSILSLLRSEVLQLLKAPTQTTPADSANSWSLLPQPSQGTRVVLMVGVNGVGKTTTTGKLAFQERQAGRSVIVGAADTFRAAAVDQLEEWARRAGAECVRLAEGSDPASVAFECVKKAVANEIDLCLIDTAGRLHNRNDLMQELGKIRRVASKDVPGAPHEVLLVLDATTGQNALQQARAFKDIAGVTGLVLTKLDGTAKGGVAIALAAEMNLPIRYIGVGESVEDLQPFNAEEFVEALFSPALPQKNQSPAVQTLRT